MAATREKKVPALVDKPMDFCPGCGHGIISRLIMEALEELDQMDNIIFPIGVGCSSNLGAGLECDRLHCCPGRARGPGRRLGAGPAGGAKNAGNPWEVRKSSAGTAAERGTASTAVLRRTVTTGNLRLP